MPSDQPELPQQSIPITFENVSYAVPVRSKRSAAGNGEESSSSSTIPILQNLTGAFLPGKLSALVGKSGAGKTTLLDILAGRKTTGLRTGGDILFDGQRPSVTTYRTLVGYVEQFDTLVGELTVEQMLLYTAALKLPRSTTTEQRRQRVEEVLAMLDLTSCRHTVIGNALRRGISGGQAKRVNIGLALTQRPPVLLLDEPTSGLDSRSASEVVVLLQALARQQRTVVCTIHAPSGHAFELFDDLYMMDKGRTIYQGPVAQVQSYFEALGHPRDLVASLPEWLVDLTSDMERIYASSSDTYEIGKDLAASSTSNHVAMVSSDEFAKAYEESQLKQQMDAERVRLLANVKKDDATDTEARRSTVLHPHHSPPSELSKLVTLLKFRTMAHYADFEFVGPRFGDKVMFALLFMSLYWRIGNEVDPRSVASVASLFFFITAKCGFGAAAFVPALTLERRLYYRELADGCYAPITYYFAKFIEEAFIALFTSLVFTVTVYFGCDLQGSFGIFFVAYYLTTLVGVVLAYTFSALFSSLSAANSWLPTYVTVNLYFSGFVILTEKIPPGWQWAAWTSFMRYSWGAMMVNNFQDSDPGRAKVYFEADGNSSQTVLEFYGMDEGPIMDSAGACLGLLTAILVFFTVLGVLALVYIRHDKR